MGTQWVDDFSAAIKTHFSGSNSDAIEKRYKNAFKSNYCDKFTPEQSLVDIERIEQVRKSGNPEARLFIDDTHKKDQVGLKFYHPTEPVCLSDIIPMLEHMSFRILSEIPYKCKMADSDDSTDINVVWVHSFTLVRMDGSIINVDEVSDVFEKAFGKIWNGEVDDDGFNCLVLVCGLDWRDVEMLRAYARYLRQTGINLSQDYINMALAANPSIIRMLVEFFHERFDPQRRETSAKRCVEIASDIKAALEEVSSADEDRIIRRFLNLMGSTLRTNFYMKDENGNYKPSISFKLDSSEVYELPLPRPMVEVYVFSSRVEAIHLRGGMVARGGLRWSDRLEDFRTEVLGLMKAQQVKNVVIVPVGSKGGFVVKNPPVGGTREEQQAEGIACYKTFMRGLLDITDNLVDGEIVHPQNVVRYDGDDPYLVVAADKGTATFSDIANSVSKEYGFWLDDAFASGGSVGYDHKEMGITAKGAWESVKRHFREEGLNTQTTDFTCVGVGDMAGDVFGNGMLLSEHIRLIGAFNHMHIFIDPNPDAAASFKERKRMFELPRSTWDDYNKELISEGGGIFDRKSKYIKLTPQIKDMFGFSEDRVPPTELIKAMLKAEVDLLWFGGIGTYVKSSRERDADVGDRNNDALRVDATEVRARVVGEGANLGMTQLARIEMDGRCYTDAIDNSAGVDCSDHEVNIKILLNEAVKAGDITTEQRNKLLATMTDEVSELVLEDNYLQTQAISIMLAQGPGLISDQKRLFALLEESGLLNRDVEFLPSNDEMNQRFAIGECLTRPELAILMPYSKLWLFDEILDSDLPDDPALVDELVRYFPTPLHDKYRKYMDNHRLKREIIATSITNSLINRVGGTFVTALMEKTGMPPSVIARAYIIGRIAFATCDIWDQIEELDNKVDASVQIDMLIEVNRILERITQWILRFGPKNLDLGTVIPTLTKDVEENSKCLDVCMTSVNDDYITRHAKTYMDQGVPENTARRVAGMAILSASLDIGELVRNHNFSVETITKLYFAVGREFDLRWMRDALRNDIVDDSHWSRLAIAGLEEAFFNHQRNLCARILETMGSDSDDVGVAIAKWIEHNKIIVDRVGSLLLEIKNTNVVELSMMVVASRNFRALTS